MHWLISLQIPVGLTVLSHVYARMLFALGHVLPIVALSSCSNAFCDFAQKVNISHFSDLAKLLSDCLRSIVSFPSN